MEVGDMTRKYRSLIYEIKVQGHLDESWSNWFEGMTITVDTEPDSRSITTLTGEVADQAALQGILLRIHDLNMELISVTQVVPETTGGQPHDDTRRGSDDRTCCSRNN